MRALRHLFDAGSVRRRFPPRTLDAIQHAIARLLAGRTSFVVAHRLSTIRNADRILVISDGRIIEDGTHRELMRLRGRYHDLSVSQFIDESVDGSGARSGRRVSA